MDLYLLDSNFNKDIFIEDFISVIWTERFNKPGEVRLVVPATTGNISKYQPGCFIGRKTSNEVMLIESQLIEQKSLVLNGFSLLKFLDERPIRFGPKQIVRSLQISGKKPGELISYLVDRFCITGFDVGDPFSGDWGIARLDGVIPNLILGAIDTSGPTLDIPIEYESLLEAISKLAQTYTLGMSLSLIPNPTSSDRLQFINYAGRNLTRTQSINPVVTFSPVLDSLVNVKELRSITGYKNVCYAFATSLGTFPGDAPTDNGRAYADASAMASRGFNRRVLMIHVDDLNPDNYTYASGTRTQAQVAADLTLRAKDALANNNFTKVVDGEVVSQSLFKYDIDYKLGDIIELQALSNTLQDARVTEYIWSQDVNGERSYPTVSVIS